MTDTSQYDYIISGMGCAGLSLAIHLVRSGRFSDKKILLIDEVEKTRNDRTWCFWETSPGIFEDIVYRHWKQAWFHNDNFSRLLHLQPFHYKLIRGIDFYNYCLGIIRKQPNFEIRQDKVLAILPGNDRSSIKTRAGEYSARYIFNSILFEKPVMARKEYALLQHFKGWVIKTKPGSFDANTATLMDFRVDQSHGTTFVYLMPFSANEALVEYTLFTKELLDPASYDIGLKDYIDRILHLQDYEIVEEETGTIPMTNHRFTRSEKGVINIGTAGGLTKPSSGYTFNFIQKHSAQITKMLGDGAYPLVPTFPGRFHFYDSVLLNILHNNTLPGQRIFTELFKKNKPQQVLRFLDNESSIVDELKIISSLPTMPFLRSAIGQL